MSTEASTQGNPAVVGLAGFGISTLVLQFHNVGWCGIGPVFALAIIFGGLAQLIAGFQEFKCGNNFGYCAFVSYGAFWLTFGTILICNKLGFYQSSHTDVGWFLIGYTILSIILWVPAMRIHGMMATTFTLVVIGFILLDLAHFGYPQLTKVAGYELMLCALCALYMMASAIYNQVFGREVLPLGAPWIKDKRNAPDLSSDNLPEAA
ncbi:acetate uptake transporter [Verrucomicrobiaceae bacterium N1E253]|uniref:Acetate uptake transporter n=1 Tax=Oceaniferula marina TaxID=2748318 RepID=A0A851GMW1_9BACT|nr:acetate uptake transporter [Oceaniferula marina]NWK56170.1 acetate uptake transporter [Oceaniferula marina]